MAVPEKIDDDDLEFGDVVSNEIKLSLKNTIDYLSAIVAIGEIAPIMTNIPGVPTPDPNIWQECNGSEITNENSPLRTVGDTINTTPDMREHYIKVPLIFGTSGVPGGENDTFLFRHDHAGRTGEHINPDDDVDSGDDDDEAVGSHSHTIAFDFDFQVNVEPPFFTVKFFMRIQ